MELIALIIVAAVIYYFANSGINKHPPSKKNSVPPSYPPTTFTHPSNSIPHVSTSRSGDSESQGYPIPIPKDYQIFSGAEVAGVTFRKDDALRFARGSNQELTLEREPNNTHDKNAIKVIGKSSGWDYFIGYVPKDIAAQIIETELFNRVKPRLMRIYQGTENYLEIHFQIIGPKVDKKQFDAYITNQPANTSQKDYYKFFDLSAPRGLTKGVANQVIKDHRKSLEASDPSKLKEYDAYRQIIEEFDDSDFRDINDLKKVSRTILNQAIDQLKQEGKTYEHLLNEIEEVVERVLSLNPDLEKN